jgi:hypothetical protein
MKIVDHQHEVRVRISVEGLQCKYVASLRVLQDVGLEIGLVLFLHLFSVDYVHSVFKHASLNKHPPDLFQESGLTAAVVPADVNVLGLTFATQLPEDFVNLLPFPIDQLRTLQKIAINVVRLAITGRNILVGSRHYLNGVLFVLKDHDLDLLELFAKVASELLEYLNDSLLGIVDVDQPLYKLLGQRDLTFGNFDVALDHLLYLVRSSLPKLFEVELLEFVELFTL